MSTTHSGDFASGLQDAPFLEARTIIDALGDPDATALVNIHIGRVANQGFRGEKRNLKAIGYFKGVQRLGGGLGANAAGVFGEAVGRKSRQSE